MKVGYVIVSHVGNSFDLLWHEKKEDGQIVPVMFDDLAETEQERYEDGHDDSDFVGVLIWVKDTLTILDLSFNKLEQIQYSDWLKDKQ